MIKIFIGVMMVVLEAGMKIVLSPFVFLALTLDHFFGGESK